MRLWKNGGSWRPGLPGKFPLKNGKIFYSVAPLSWFPGSRIPTAHVHQCCRFQSYAKSRRLHAVAHEIDKRNLESVNHIPGIHDNGRVVTSDLKSDVTRPDHVVRCCGSQECGSCFVNFACQFHRRWHSFRITLKSTTLLFMRSSVWTMKPWQRVGANDVWALTTYYELAHYVRPV